MDSQNQRSVFLSYSHQDDDWLSVLRPYLMPLERSHKIVYWDDTKIRAGTPWREDIKKTIASCDAALLLITEAFIASEFINNNELPPLLEKASRIKGMLIFPLILKHCSFEHDERINRFQSLNSPQTPLSTLDENELARFLVDTAQKIKTSLDKIAPLSEVPQSDLGPDTPSMSYSTPPEMERITPPDQFVDQRVLLLDIDGTILHKGERLDDHNKKKQLDLLEFFVKRGFHVVFITGNDYSVQRRNVLLPVMRRGIAESITCFSDHGSRLFEFNNRRNDYDEHSEYSQRNKIPQSHAEIITGEFEKALNSFLLSDDRHKGLCIPNVSELRREYKANGQLKFLDLITYPLKPSFYSESFDRLSKEIDRIIDEFDIQSVPQFLDKYASPGALILRLMGPYSDKDAERVRSELLNVFMFVEDFKDASKPEVEMRGGDDFISQIAIKPFKPNRLRKEFLSMFRSSLSSCNEVRDFEVMLGGRTTIDILLKGVDKRKAILDLITRRRYSPRNMIYFGDEFVTDGNDLPVLSMDEDYRPSRIIHVGSKDDTPEEFLDLPGFFIDGNGDMGTRNYLEFLKEELA